MSQEPADGNGSGRSNALVIVLLVIIGVMGAWIMYRSLDRPAPAPVPAKEDPASLAGRIQSGMDSMGVRSPVAGYAIRLSPYSEVATAEAVRAKLDALGIPSSLRVEAQVQVGPFRTSEDAEAARAKLKDLGVLGGQVITLKP